LRTINTRGSKLHKLIDEFNSLIDDLDEGVEKPSKLDRKNIGDLCFTEEFWELDRAFRCKERWSLDPDLRKAIDAMYHNLRAIEEIFILGSEAERYYNWLASRLDNCEQLLRVINVDSAIGNNILNVGLKAADALERLVGLAGVNLGGGEKFKSVQEKLQRKLIRKYLC
jgi:hypothetical protein